jgi:hypothetical protein
MPDQLLWGEVKGFKADVEALQQFYTTRVMPIKPTPYHDNGADYVGWSVTSRDGTVTDGVKQVRLSSSGQQRIGEATQPTALCDGPVRKAIDDLYLLGLDPFRVRIMSMSDSNEKMTFHKDANREGWRLHVPIITNSSCFFEWKLEKEDKPRRVHLPADGRAWFVRVDVQHRAVNCAVGCGDRVHLLMSLKNIPPADVFGGSRGELASRPAFAS